MSPMLAARCNWPTRAQPIQLDSVVPVRLKLKLRAANLITVLCGVNFMAGAQTVVWSENFDSYSLGSFGSTYNYASGGNVTSTIVTPGSGGTGQALQLSGNITNGLTENAGVNSPVYTPSSNTDPDLSDYALSFDLAITQGTNTGFSLVLNIFGTGAADGSSYTVPISQNTVGGGFQHYSVNLGTLPAGYQIPALNPTDSQYSFQLLFLGYNASVTATPETILLDNLQVTMTANTNVTSVSAATNYSNPPIYADYPDPDIIRVGNDFYFSTTTFVDSPGLTVLHSQDMVHWEIVSHVISPLDWVPNLANDVVDYRNGVFASSLRYYNGTFYVVETPNGQATRVYHSTSISGPWQYYQLSVGAFDPGFYIETNGTGYIVSVAGFENYFTIYTLNANYSQVTASATLMTNSLALEGSHVVRVGGYYYIFNSQPGTATLYCSRSTNLFGPYMTMSLLNNNTGGHQGAIVDMPDGSYYGFVHKDSGAIGRVTYISPIIWSNNWPVWGLSNAPGRIPAIAPVPILGKPAYTISTSDDFSSSTLGLQWQWNHNPDNTRWSLTARPGFLRLYPTGATNFWFARNTLIQKGQGPTSAAEVKFDLSNLQPGDVCGFGTLGKTNGNISVICGSGGSLTLSMNLIVPTDGTGTNLSTTTVATAPFAGTTIYLRTALDFIHNLGLCSYSSDGANWTALGGKFNLAYDWATGTFQGEQYAIFCYNAQPGTGYVDMDWFRFAPPAFITGITPNSNSGAMLNFANSPNSTNIIQATTDLNTWQNISTNVADAGGLWQITDTNQQPAKFYRSYSP
jgi:beta-xylosidase